MAEKRLCSIPDCGKPACNSRGWCNAHYLRFRRHGDPMGVRALNGAHRSFFEAAILYTDDACLFWPFRSKTEAGYGFMWHEGRRFVASRLVCETVHGPAPTSEHEAAHSCGNGALGCCAPRHISWKTRVENQHDRIEHGTTNRGERCGTSKLTSTDVRSIRRLGASRSQAELASKYGVTPSHISGILSRDKWAWLPD